jgi:tetratricopeptide (TPR) repeat protein
MTLSSDLDSLVAADMIRAVPDVADLEYEFRHALIQEAAYHEILKEDRTALHLAVGEAMERLHADHLDEVAAELAFHFRRAGEHDKTVMYLTRSADLAAARFANDEALAALAEALELVADDDPRTCGLHERMGEVCLLVGRRQEALEAFRLASDRAASTLERARLERKCGSCFPMGPDFDATLDHLQRAADLLGTKPFDDAAAWWQEWIEVRIERSYVLYFLSYISPERRTELTSLLEQMKGPLERWGTARQRARYWIDCVGASRFMIDAMRPGEAMLQIAHECIAAADASEDARMIAHSRFILGLYLLTRSELDPAVSALSEAARMTDDIGDAEWGCRSLIYLGIAARRLGDVVGVRAALERADPLVAHPGFGLYRGAAIANRAWLAQRTGETADAQRGFDEALQVWAETKLSYPFAWIAAMPALALAIERDDLGSAAGYATTITGSPSHTLPDEVEELLRSGVEAWGSGRADEARHAFGRGVERAAELNYS